MNTVTCAKVLTRGTIPETTGRDRDGHVLLGGVPLAKGLLREPGSFLLTVPAGSFPVEGQPAAWWPDGSIKWLRLCGAVALKGGQDNPFTLSGPEPSATAGIVVNHLPGIEEIITPFMTVRISPDPHRVLQVRRPDGRPWTRGPGLSARLRPAQPGGDPRAAVGWSFDPPGLQVVEAGAARVVVRLAGRFVEDGRTLAELVTFIEIVKDEPRLGIQPVLIYLGDPDRDALAAIDLTLHTASGGDDARFGFGQEACDDGYWDACQWVDDGPRWPQARLVQTGSTFYRLDKRTGPSGSWVKIAEGQRAQGWCHLGDPAGGVTGAMRYFWQEYPRSLSVDADAGTLTFGLIPASGEPLDLRRYSPVILGTTIYESGEGAFPAQSHGATGIAKSSELMVRFHAAEAPQSEAARAGCFWTHPARIIPDPDAFAASGVAGVLAARAPAACEGCERRMEELTDFLLAEREARGWYGFMDFGDIMQTYYTARGQWAFDDGGFGWVNSEALPDLGLWLMALRHGRPDWLEGAIAMTRHNRDVDMYHRGNFKGVGSRHNVNHWGCKDKEWRVSMPLVKRLHYYLTGDPWTREVILETVAVYQSYDRTASAGASMPSALGGLMVKAELTGDARDVSTLLELAGVFAQAVRHDGHFVRSLHANLGTGVGEPIRAAPGTDGAEPPSDSTNSLLGSYFFLQGFGGQHILTEVAETYGHAALLQALVRHAAVYLADPDPTRPKPLHGPVRNDALPFLALAWRQTGETRFRDAIAAALTQGWQGPDLVEAAGADSGGTLHRRELAQQGRRNKITCSIGGLMHQRPYGYAALYSDGQAT